MIAYKQSNREMAGTVGCLNSVMSCGRAEREDTPLLSSKMPKILRTREENNVIKEK